MFGALKNPKRPMIKRVKAQNKKNLRGVEVGTWEGEHAKDILDCLDVKKLYCVDAYQPYIDGDTRHTLATDPRPRKEVATRTLLKYGWRVVMVEEDSIQASRHISDGSVDFVYLDGCHTYEYVKKELKAWYPKVKSGGLFGGHDIHFYGVMRAVGEFAQKRRLHPDVDKHDWWIEKP